ncbi:MAG: carbohydrate kinase family protein [Lysobacterales bacterium]|nr:MAG: carbohydrate kinase family protein [Xanthomonadales bacterium]
MPDCEVLLFGDYTCDIIITGLREIPRLGADIFGETMEIVPGGAYNSTVALHRLGVKSRWAARLGNDLFSRFLLEEAHREDIDTSLFEQYPVPFRNMSVSFSFSHERGFISHTDPAPEGISIFDIVADQKPHWVVNPPFDGSAESRSIVNFIHQNGGRVFTDCQYMTMTLSEPGLTQLLSDIDIFAPNLSEAYQLTGAEDAQTAAAILAQHCPLTIIKCGADGALARAGTQVWHVPAISVKAVDTTGAGDCFNAGFLYAHMQGEPIETCLRYGNICGGLSVTQRGGASAAPTLVQLKKYL